MAKPPPLFLSAWIAAQILSLIFSAGGLYAQGAELPDSVQPGDSAAVHDTLAAERPAVGKLRLRGQSAPAALLADSLGVEELAPARLKLAYPLYLDDIFRLNPAFVSGDSLGNGYARKFSSLGTGFAGTGVYLNGMPLDDPLTGQVDWRILAPEILGGASVIRGGAFGGARGWADEVYLTTRRPDPALSASSMEIAGGAYDINKVAGGLRRRMFGSGALHVQINKIQQTTEDFVNRVEHIQYYNRVEWSLGRKTLLSADGLFFSNDQRSPGLPVKLRQTNAHIRTAVTGELGAKADYSLAYGFAASRHPFSSGVSARALEARRNSLQVNLLYHPAEKVTLGLDLQTAATRPAGWPDTLALRSLSNRKISALVRFEVPRGWRVAAEAGVRNGKDLKTEGIAGLSLAGDPAGVPLVFTWKRETLQPFLAGAALVPAPGAGSRNNLSQAVSDDIRAELGLRFKPQRSLRLGMFTRKLKNLPLAPYAPDPLDPAPVPAADYRASGISYRFEGPLVGALALSAAGIELFNPPKDVPYLARRRHTAALSMEGVFFGSDLGYSVQGEMAYEGALYFPNDPLSRTSLALQPARVNFGGAASLRIIDFTIYGRVDFLMSNYYNGVDPLNLPGPRAVFGVNWDFRN